MFRTFGKLALLALASIFFATPAMAQSQCAAIKYGAVLTVAQWQFCFQGKNDLIGYAPVNKAGDVMLGNLTLAPINPLTIPQAAISPSSPVNGAVWMTASGMFYRANGTTFGPLTSGGGGFGAGTGLQVQSGNLNVLTGTSARTSVSTAITLANTDCASFVGGSSTTTTVTLPSAPQPGCKFKLSPGLGDMLVNFNGNPLRIPGYGGHDITELRLPAMTENSYLAISWDGTRWDPDDHSGLFYENFAPLDDQQLQHGQVLFAFDGTTFLTLTGKNGPCGLIVDLQKHTLCSTNVSANGLKLNKSATTNSTLNYFYVTNVGSDVVTGTSSDGGLVKLTLTTALTGAVVGDQVHVLCFSIGGTVEANGSWTGTVTTDTNHVDLLGSAFANAWTSGGICRIEFMVASTSGHTTQPNGVEVNSAAISQTLVGMCYVGAAHAIANNSTNRNCASWFNRGQKTCRATLSADHTVTSTTYAEVDSGSECNFVTWGDTDLRWSASGGASSGTTANVFSVSAGFDGVTAEPEEIGMAATLSTEIFPIGLSGSKSGLTEGLHYITLLAKQATAGTVKVYGTTPDTSIEIAIPQ